jgi:hypothetical protein
VNTKEKRDAIIEYAKKQMLVDISTLGFPLMKTTDRFRSNYNLHDDVLQYVLSVYSKHGYMLTSIDVDLRNEKVMVLNALPDYMAERCDGSDDNNNSIFCFDLKVKSDIRYFGYVNKRDAISYRRLADECSVKVYVISVNIYKENNVIRIKKIGYSNILDKPIRKERMWDGNIAWIYEWYEGLPELNRFNH